MTIDGQEVRAKAGEKLLWVALDHGIYIPNLCAMRKADLPIGGCRLCFIEVEGRRAPVTACSQPAENGMVVRTDTPQVKRLRCTAFELLLSHHSLDCAHCPKNKKCELQKIAAHQGFKLKLGRLRRIQRDLPIDSSHPLISYDPNKCVLCGRCVRACLKVQMNGVIDVASRGSVTPFELYLLDHGDTYPAAQDPVSVEPYYWLWMGRGWRRVLAEYVPGKGCLNTRVLRSIGCPP